MSVFRRWVQQRLGGYRQAVNRPDAALPEGLVTGRPVAVVGAGLAGLCAAITLARRGFKVTLLEKNPYLGGKIGAWPITLPSGETQTAEHGFHAFFHHYYNLNAFLDSMNLRRWFRTIEDYAILALDGRSFSFRDVEKTPVFNILSMQKAKIWNFGQLAKNPRLFGILAMLRYDPVKTYRRFDDLSYQSWSERVGLPPSMRLMFNSFSRAFFASPDRMSTGELLKSFHSFFLSHDGGLLYDYPTQDYDTAFLKPIRQELDRLGVRIQLGQTVDSLERTNAGFTIQGDSYDSVVLAANATATRGIIEASPTLKDPALVAKIRTLIPSQGYAVLRLWTDRLLETGLPSFFITEHREVLDSVSLFHGIDETSRRWSERTGGGVYELHCYAIPDHLTNETEIRNRLIEEFLAYFPVLRGMKILHENWQAKHDFTALHTGLQRNRPTTESGIPGLFLAGDWVKLPFPAMLMEAAASSGLMAANAILRTAGLREQQLWSVPPRGLFAFR